MSNFQSLPAEKVSPALYTGTGQPWRYEPTSMMVHYENVIIAVTGELNDGQHRLSSLVEANVNLVLLFTFGAERESRLTVDQGANRSMGDYLQMSGVPNGAVVASIARLILSFERSNREVIGATNRVTPAEIREKVSIDHRELGTSATYGNRHANRMRPYASPSVIAFCHYVLLSQNVTEGLAFMEMLCTGEGLVRDDPAYRAREKLANMGRSSTASKIEIIFRAWNAYREKRPMKTIPVHGRLPKLV